MGSTNTLRWKRRTAVAIISLTTSASGLSTGQCFAGGHSHGPIYKTLDALAGGIEKVIDATASLGRKSSSKCDGPSCDDGCDAMTLAEFETNYRVNEVEVPMPPMVPDYPLGPVQSVPMPPSMPMVVAMPKSTPLSDPMPVPMPAPRVNKPMPKPVPMPAPAPTKPSRSPDDEWFDSFSPEPVSPNTGDGKTPIRTNGRPALRNPVDTYDSLPNPFEDDPQSRAQPKSLNRPVSYWEPW